MPTAGTKIGRRVTRPLVQEALAELAQSIREKGVLQPLLGIVGERIDRRYAAALGPLMTGLGLTMMGFMPWFGALILLIAIAGFGSGFFHPAGAAYVAQNSPPDRRGLWASIFSAGGTGGMALGPVFAGVGLTHLPWFALIGAVIAAVTFMVTPSGKQQSTVHRIAHTRLFSGAAGP